MTRIDPFIAASTGKGMITIPWSLKERDLELLLEAGPQGQVEEIMEETPYLSIFERAGLDEKLQLRNLVNKTEANKKAYQKLRYLAIVLTKNPGLYTQTMRELIEGSPFWTKFLISKRMDLVKSTGQTLLQVLPKEVEMSPLGREETIKTEIQEELINKIQMTLRSLTASKISKAEMGTLTKGLENLMKVYSLFKGEGNGGKFLQINIGKMTLAEKREASLRAADTNK